MRIQTHGDTTTRGHGDAQVSASPCLRVSVSERRRARHCRAFTLAEALVAMTMFTIITAATSLALTAALRSQQATRERIDETQEARALLDTLSRDFREAYASSGDPNTYFVAQGADTGPIVQFTALTHRIVVPPTDPSQGQPGDYGSIVPQSNLALINYYLDSQTGTLSRCETSVPDQNALPDPSDPSTVLSRHVVSVALEFLDSDGNARTDWSFTNEDAQQTSGQSGATPASTDQSADTTLPQAVQIQITLARQSAPPITYSTVVTLVTPQPQAAGQKPPTTTSTTGGGGGTPGGGTPGGGTPGGGTPGGGTPGGGTPGGGTPGAGGLPTLPGTGVRP